MAIPWDWVVQLYQYLTTGSSEVDVKISHLDIPGMTAEKLDDLNLPPEVKHRLWLRMELEKEKSKFHL